MIQASPEIGKLLGDSRQPSDEGVMLASQNYYALGCDLSHPEQLETQLKSLFDVDTTSFCFVAEVSVTYMKERAADKLIRWASGIKYARFCILEQCLPWGNEHPFAKTMLSHFNKLGTRLRSLKNYPTIEHQKRRFETLGWGSVRAISLWRQWSASDFVTNEERLHLNSVEPFDEWEDFVLFAQHYFILVASSASGNGKADTPKQLETPLDQERNKVAGGTESFWLENSGPNRAPVRAHGVCFTQKGNILCHHGGYGLQRRLADTDIFSQCTQSEIGDLIKPPAAVGEIMCHTATVIEGENIVLLTGGRKSPDCAFSDCWVNRNDTWRRSESLPRPLYRHCAISLSAAGPPANGVIAAVKKFYVLVYGGKYDQNEVSGDWYIYEVLPEQSDAQSRSWRKLQTEGTHIEPRFGSSMCQLWENRSNPEVFDGLVMGGMTTEGLIADSVFTWTVDTTKCSVRLTPYKEPGYLTLCRFGAKGTSSARSNKSRYYLTGGIAGPHEEPQDYRPIILMNILTDVEKIEIDKPFSSSMDTDRASGRYGPLLTGHNALCLTTGEDGDMEDEIILVGGSAVCFSFGSFHNKSIWSLRGGQETKCSFQLIEVNKSAAFPHSDKTQLQTHASSLLPVAIPVPKQSGLKHFQKLLDEGRPKVLQGLRLGSCTETWNCDNLKAEVGGEKEVIVHSSENDVMNFQSKNFEYKKIAFGKFLDLIQSGERQYLRALSSISTTKPANFWEDFPELAHDFRLPDELSEVIDKVMPDGRRRAHSSVLRLSGPVAMWLHYDVMANVLCQIKGRKHLILFPPSNVTLLGIPPGQSSSDLNMFDPNVYNDHPELRGVQPHEVLLEPGDVLFIPALWLHTAQPAEGISMAVNVFFRDLDSGYANGRDAYGNRDLQAYEDGRRDVKGIVSRFRELPRPARQFYLQRLAQELQVAAEE